MNPEKAGHIHIYKQNGPLSARDVIRNIYNANFQVNPFKLFLTFKLNISEFT